MTYLRRALAAVPLLWIIIACLTLGLAPFFPEPHIWEKLKMLASGALRRPVDIFDLLFHGVPWLLLGHKVLLGNQSRP